MFCLRDIGGFLQEGRRKRRPQQCFFNNILKSTNRTSKVTVIQRPATDELNKMFCEQGSYSIVMDLNGKRETIIHGYTIALCTREDLIGIRHRIKVDEAKRAKEPLTPE